MFKQIYFQKFLIQELFKQFQAIELKGNALPGPQNAVFSLILGLNGRFREYLLQKKKFKSENGAIALWFLQPYGNEKSTILTLKFAKITKIWKITCKIRTNLPNT